MTAIVIPTTETYAWSRLRKGLGDLIRAAAPLAQVHEEWKLEFNPTDSLGKVTALLKGLDKGEGGNHSTFVHSWMIGLAAESPIVNENGDDRYIGGFTSEYMLAFAVWGFFDYKGWRSTFGNASSLVVRSNELDGNDGENSTAAAENEARRIKAFIRANPTLLLDDGRACAQPFGIDNMDVHGFSGGNSILVVQGLLNVRVRESFV